MEEISMELIVLEGFQQTRCSIAMVKILERHQWKSSSFSKALLLDLQ